MEGTVQRAETTFESLLGGLSVDEFRSRYQGKEWLRVPAAARQASHLIEWSELNTELGKLRAVAGRIHMIRRAVTIQPSAFCYGKGRTGGERLNSAAVQTLLDSGATLLVTFVDEIFPKVRDLVEEIESTLETIVWANLYLGCRHEPGFALHWDEHDTLIVQIKGRKHWRVFPRTAPWPLASESGDYRTDCPTPNDDQLLWRGELAEGDVLYMPRGFWHDATPLDEPSLHITIGIKRPTMRMLLRWYIDTFGDEVVRQDLPYDDSFEAPVRTFTEMLNQQVATQNQAGSASLASSFRTWWNKKRLPRPRFDLPISDRRDMRALRLGTIHRPQMIEETNGHVKFQANGRRWSVPREVWKDLETLTAGSSAADGGSDDAQRLEGQHKNFYRALIAGGVLAAERK